MAVARRCLFVALVFNLSLSASAGLSATAPLEVSGAWLRLPPPGATVTAGYMQVHNPGAEAVTITGIATASPTHVELHTSALAKDGSMSMHAVPAIVVPPGATVALEPAGMHAMVFAPPALQPGAGLEFKLQLKDGRQVSARFVAKRP